jgi:hypothetical protein
MRETAVGLVSVTSPALCLHVVDVNVLAHGDGSNHPPDVDAVLDDGVVLSEIDDGELVPDGNVVLRVDLDVPLLIHDPAVEAVTGGDSFDNNDSDGVVFVMNDEMEHWHLSRIGLSIMWGTFDGDNGPSAISLLALVTR